MKDEESVLITKEPGIHNQFGKGYSYQNTPVVSKKALIASATAFSVAVTAGLWGGAPSQENESSEPSQFSSPEIQSNTQTITIPDQSHNEDTKTSPGKSAPRQKTSQKFTGPELLTRPKQIKVPPGTFVSAVLRSGASNGPVKAELLQAVVLNGETLAEEGTILIGTGSSTEDRLFIAFNKMVFRDGSFAPIQAQATDETDKTPGIKGSTVGHQARRLALGIGLNFVGGMSDALQDSTVQQGAVLRSPSVKNALLSGSSRAAIEQSQEIMTENRNKPQIMEVKVGTPIFVLFSGE